MTPQAVMPRRYRSVPRTGNLIESAAEARRLCAHWSDGSAATGRPVMCGLSVALAMRADGPLCCCEQSGESDRRSGRFC
jgi:hypothetical protein